MSIVTISTFVASRALYNVLCPEILIKSVTTLTTSLISGVYHLISITKDTDLHKILITSDIIHDVTIIKSYIEDMEKTENKTILACIHNLNDTLTQLEHTINSITKKFELHKSLWFSYFRSYDITSEKESVLFLTEQLKHRFELLIKISSTIK